MKECVITSPSGKAQAMKLVDVVGYPCTIKIYKGKQRTNSQNKTQRLWINEACEFLQDRTTEELRAYLKLHYGVPILRNEDDDFREAYDRIIKPHSYEDKLAMMAVPLDFPVTRLMRTKQKAQYLDAIYQHIVGDLGCQLTIPNEPPISTYG